MIIVSVKCNSVNCKSDNCKCNEAAEAKVESVSRSLLKGLS